MHTNQNIQKPSFYVRQIYFLGGQCLNRCIGNKKNKKIKNREKVTIFAILKRRKILWDMYNKLVSN